MLKSIFLVCSVLSIFACSSNSKDSSEPRAPINDSGIAQGAVETTLSTINAGDSPDIDIPTLFSPMQAKMDNASELPVGATESFGPETVYGSCGGTMVMRGSGSYSGNEQNPFPIDFDMSIDFNEFCEDGAVVNGDAEVEMYFRDELNGSMTIEFDLWGTDVFGDDQSYQVYMSCELRDGLEDCDEQTWYVSTAGHRLNLAEFVVEGDDVSGYTVAGNLEVEGQSDYMLNAADLTVCAGGKFDSGTIELYEDAELYMTIEITACGEYEYMSADGETGEGSF